MSLQYIEPQNYSDEEIENILKNGTTDKVCDMLVGVTFNQDDYAKVTELLIKASITTNSEIISTVFECFGHVARIHGNVPKNELKLIFSLHKDKLDGGIPCGVHCLLEDLSVYLPSVREYLIK